MFDKRTTMEAAAETLQDGQTLALGGMTLYRRPIAFVKTLVKQHRLSGKPRDLTLLAFTAGLESDLLVGAGIVQHTRTCYFGLEILGLAPMFTYYAGHGLINVIEETEASLALGLRACLAGIGFMPGHAWLGTDLPRLRPDVHTITDPYTGEELMAFPAIKPDVAVIHALSADPEGNALIGKNKGIDIELALAAGHVIITTEEIIPELEQADITAPFVQAVVLAPHGASPTSCHPLYPVDGEAIMAYTENVSDPDTFNHYLDQFLAG